MTTPLITRRRVLPLLLLPLVSTIALSTTANAAAAPVQEDGEFAASETITSNFCPAGEEVAFLDLINTYRKSKGLDAMRISGTLGAAANHHSQDMAKHNYFSHELFNGTSWNANIQNYGYTASGSLGENIAAGNRTAKETFANWKSSKEHNLNMLEPTFHAIGIARASNASSTYGYYWTTTFGGAFDAKPRC